MAIAKTSWLDPRNPAELSVPESMDSSSTRLLETVRPASTTASNRNTYRGVGRRCQGELMKAFKIDKPSTNVKKTRLGLHRRRRVSS
jgi:hypothetical protein